MNNHLFNALIDLVDFDQQTIALKNNVSKLENETSVIERQRISLEKSLEEAKNIFQDIKKYVDLSELEIKGLDQQIKDKKIQLDQVANQKEYISIKKEIEQLQKKQNDSEEPLVHSWNRLEQVRIDYKKQEEDYEKNLLKIKDQIEENLKNIDQAKNDLKQHLEKRDEKVKIVPKEWLEKYEVLGSRVPDPFVPVDRGSCTACFYDVTPQAMVELKNGKLVQCKGCYRFLYIKKQE